MQSLVTEHKVKQGKQKPAKPNTQTKHLDVYSTYECLCAHARVCGGQKWTLEIFFLDCSHLIYLKFICMSENLLICVCTLCTGALEGRGGCQAVRGCVSCLLQVQDPLQEHPSSPTSDPPLPADQNPPLAQNGWSAQVHLCALPSSTSTAGSREASLFT